MSRTASPVLQLIRVRAAKLKILEAALMRWRPRRHGGQFRHTRASPLTTPGDPAKRGSLPSPSTGGNEQARRPSHGNGGTPCPDAIFSASSREPAERAWVSLPRHETALFGSERCVWRELEGIGAPGADDRSNRSPECVQFMRVPVAAPLRVGASSNCPFASSGDRHRYDLAGRSAQHPATSTLRIASEPGMAPRTRAAIKPSLTLTRLILPRCTQAP